MKQVLLVLTIIIVLTACKKRVSVSQMQIAIKEDIQNKYGALVDSVCLIKKEEYEYVGYASVYVGQSANIELEVLLDKENPMNYIYKIPNPGALLLQTSADEVIDTSQNLDDTSKMAQGL